MNESKNELMNESNGLMNKSMNDTNMLEITKKMKNLKKNRLYH